MRRSLEAFATVLPLAAAYPFVMERVTSTANCPDTVMPTIPAPKYTTTRDNCGFHGPCTMFDAKDQYVDVSSSSGHAYQDPGPSDLRGQCPGLNAAANHGFLPRNGLATIEQTIDGLGAAYNMSPDLALILAVIAIAISGDPVTEQWSIGGGWAGTTLGLLGKPTGILGTHNRYEGDASIIRGDAYLHDGDVNVFEMCRWEHLYSILGPEDNFTPDKAALQAYYTSQLSVLNNPYYFSEPFSGLVAPDAHNFVHNFMSNHSAEVPGGVLNGETLKQFFSVTGEPGSFTWIPGKERIPDNWYRRPTSMQMNTVDTNVDTVINNGMYPGIIQFGGNTGKVNTFTGIDTGNLTGGLYNGETLLEGNNLSCFFLQAVQAGLADSATPLTESAGDLLTFLSDKLGPQISGLDCPQLKAFDPDLFSQYPGASYFPTGS